MSKAAPHRRLPSANRNRPTTNVSRLPKRGASIGSGAVILCGIEIGAGAMVGAGAVVTHDVAPGAVVTGNPARLRRSRTPDHQTNLNHGDSDAD